jgi:hypothetical protein
MCAPGQKGAKIMTFVCRLCGGQGKAFPVMHVAPWVGSATGKRSKPPLN